MCEYGGTSAKTFGVKFFNRVTKGYYFKEIAEGLLAEVAVQAAYIDGFLIGGEPVFYD
jgi:hypothetical protein